MGVFGSGFAFLYSCCYCFIKWCNLFFYVDSMFVWEKWAPHLQNRCYRSSISNLMSIVISRVLQSVPAIWLCHRLLRGVDSVHFPILLMGMCRQCGRWSGENPFVQVSTTWVCLDLSGNGSSDTVYDEGDWNWLSDSRVGIWLIIAVCWLSLS